MPPCALSPIFLSSLYLRYHLDLLGRNRDLGAAETGSPKQGCSRARARNRVGRRKQGRKRSSSPRNAQLHAGTEFDKSRMFQCSLFSALFLVYACAQYTRACERQAFSNHLSSHFISFNTLFFFNQPPKRWTWACSLSRSLSLALPLRRPPI